LSRFVLPAVRVPPIVSWPLALKVLVADDGAKNGPALETVLPAGTVTSQPVTVTLPAVKVPVAFRGPFTNTSSVALPSKSPPPKPPLTRTSAIVMSRSAV